MGKKPVKTYSRADFAQVESDKQYIVLVELSSQNVWEVRANGLKDIDNYWGYGIRFPKEVFKNVIFEEWSQDFESVPETTDDEFYISRTYSKSNDGTPFLNKFLLRFSYTGQGIPTIEEAKFYLIDYSNVPPIRVDNVEVVYAKVDETTSNNSTLRESENPKESNSTSYSRECTLTYTYWDDKGRSIRGQIGHCVCVNKENDSGHHVISVNQDTCVSQSAIKHFQKESIDSNERSDDSANSVNVPKDQSNCSVVKPPQKRNYLNPCKACTGNDECGQGKNAWCYAGFCLE